MTGRHWASWGWARNMMQILNHRAEGCYIHHDYNNSIMNCRTYFINCNYPAPGRERGTVFGRFLSLFQCQQDYEKTAGPICMNFSGKVWSEHVTTWLNSGSIRINGSACQRSICLLSPAIVQTTGVNKSVSFARWQRGRGGFVVPRTTACYKFYTWACRKCLQTFRLFDMLTGKSRCNTCTVE